VSSPVGERGWLAQNGRYASQVGAGRRSFAVAVSCVLAVAVLGASAGPAAAKQRRPPAPKWDPFVERIARVVEDIRGLEFERPVTVRFVPAAEFDEQNSSTYDLPKAARRRIRETEHFGRALGLFAPEDDLIEGYSESGGLLGYYDGSITVRGRRESIVTQYVLSHELTHALHDQSFNTFNITVDEGDPLALGALVALEEGDADRIAEEWLRRQSDARRARFDREYYARRQGTRSALPEVVLSEEFVPYTYGEEFASVVIAADGQRALDRMFRHPPRDDARLVNPLRSSGSRTVTSAPQLEDGEERVGRAGTSGAMGLFHLLASRIDPIVALDAAGHWTADRYVHFTRGDVHCVRAVWVSDDAGAAIVGAALARWAFAHGSATTTVAGDRVTATSCESDLTSPPQSILAADIVALARNKVIVGSLEHDADREGAMCVVHAYFDDGTLVPALLGADVGGARIPAALLDLLDQHRDAATAACGFDPGAVVGLDR